MGVFATLPDHFVVELVRVPVLVPAQPHERLACRDGADPAPEASILPELADAAADLEERLLEHVLGVFGCAADTATEVVYRGLEGAVKRLEAGGITGLRLGQNGFGVGQQVRVHDKR